MLSIFRLRFPVARRAFEQYHDRLNCFIVEPLLQEQECGCIVFIPEESRELCDQYDVLLIFDEVATGFSTHRERRFVADLVLPDILVLGKHLLEDILVMLSLWQIIRYLMPFTVMMTDLP